MNFLSSNKRGIYSVWIKIKLLKDSLKIGFVYAFAFAKARHITKPHLFPLATLLAQVPWVLSQPFNYIIHAIKKAPLEIGGKCTNEIEFELEKYILN
ncbi:hypothetical protein CW736_05650 [Nonlabens sp. MB-3u-79]|jgi:hypothetical protein|uniref:hypothetical protein n=1 Tax=Nonlabens sp. MB-3u-79 TaxID=2058134 RepID=UPI000C311BD6|nr:hypothetical protein [Nonlabens sp. MB-3u-79]AUC78911.1 hypothetical protein CW736_05650 [Nonlabens sp. MB-3u-79]